ncbi:MAG: sensor histidine kinase KdpD, partial [Leptospira sp.]|nr:sensor histidine kinase KdpD [Leptospira sp.]
MTEEVGRPDPDELLKEIQAQEKKETKGKLKIFFGMVAGVGKTYSMLQAAFDLKSRGVDVVIGYIETHKRPVTEKLTEGFTIIPRKKIDYRGVVMEEMDINAILERKPYLVLVDELAHTNVPGSRHPKRYQDVLELLDNGINVFTTVNVQHLESRAELVEKITDTTVRERIPDSILEIADEVELV